MYDLPVVNMDEVVVILNKIEDLEVREKRLEKSKSTNKKYLLGRRKELLNDYKALLTWCLLNGYKKAPKGCRGIVSTIIDELEDGVQRNTLSLEA